MGTMRKAFSFCRKINDFMGLKISFLEDAYCQEKEESPACHSIKKCVRKHGKSREGSINNIVSNIKLLKIRDKKIECSKRMFDYWILCIGINKTINISTMSYEIHCDRRYERQNWRHK